MLRIGAHVGQQDPIAEAAPRGADLVQFFLADPQDWAAELAVRYPGGAAALRAAADAAGIDLYVHAPYVMNVATTNNRIRFPSRKLLQQAIDAAAELRATGLIVHGGHVLAADDPAAGYANWRKTLERTDLKVPLLLENTAGGDHAMTRRVDAIARLWDECGHFDIGFCLDTCHAHAGGEDLTTIVDRVKAVTGRIDLVHANDSKDEFDSGRDRHENLGHGQIDPQVLIAVVQAAGAPVVCETPGGAQGQGADIAWLRERLPA
jgi:deoxyribonuclease IV